MDHDQTGTGAGGTLQLFHALRGGQETLPAPALVVKDQRGRTLQQCRIRRPALRDQHRLHTRQTRQQFGEQAAAAQIVVMAAPVAGLYRAGNKDDTHGAGIIRYGHPAAHSLLIFRLSLSGSTSCTTSSVFHSGTGVSHPGLGTYSDCSSFCMR